jgi:hypothetical protein
VIRRQCVLSLRIVRRLPASAQLCRTRRPEGRRWSILEGGNRGSVLMGSAVAVGYGDLSDGTGV